MIYNNLSAEFVFAIIGAFFGKRSINIGIYLIISILTSTTKKLEVFQDSLASLEAEEYVETKEKNKKDDD